MKKGEKSLIDLKLLGRVFSYVKPYKGVFAITLLLTLGLSLLAPLRPQLISVAVDEHIANNDIDSLKKLAGWYVLILLIESVMQFGQTYLTNWIGQSVTLDLRKKVFKHIMNFKLRYFDKNPIGTLVTRVVSDIEGISEIFSQGLLTIIGDILKLIAVIIYMFSVSWSLSLTVLIPIPILIFATKIFKNAIKKAFLQVRNQVSNLNSFVQERITGMMIVQIFTKETEEEKNFTEINEKHMKAHVKSVWAYSIFFPIVEILSSLSLALLIMWAFSGSVYFDVKPGILITFILIVHMMYRPIRQLADRFNTLQMGIVNAERVFKVLDTDASIPSVSSKEEIRIKGDLKFEKVWFAYDDVNFVLKDISFDVKAGQTVAFVGATGAGKSSVINLLSRLYEFQKGSIQIDQQELQNIDSEIIRKEVGVVLQDVFLFSDTIYNNITLYNPDISKEEVEKAAKIVGAHEFISRLPGGYEFNVRERGSVLSVGQRQLLAFIRAYVYNPSILVLDEATSSVDTESEILIQNAIDTLTNERTSIVIAHRLSTIQKADLIIVLEAGEIVEKGTHQELLSINGYYKRLFDLQFKK